MSEESAFPQGSTSIPNQNGSSQMIPVGGLTKRELYATLLLQGILATGKTTVKVNNQDKEACVGAVLLADLLTLELAK